LSKLVDRILNPVTGYLLVLLGFVSLGLFVAGLAMSSAFAVIPGLALAAFFGLAAMAFRNGSAKLATSRDAGTIGDNVSIWARPLHREQIDGYHLTYRRPQPEKTPTVLGVARPAKKREVAPMPTRLSA
jgi:hypothetical protein